MDVSPARAATERPAAFEGLAWSEGVELRRTATAFRALAGVTFGLLVFGATVRVHGAGLSCPDWPLCFGQVVPQLNMQVFLEWGHRVLAGTVSTVFLGLGAWVWSRPALRARAGWPWVAALCVLVTQIVLGGLTVLQLLAYWSVTLHLLTGNAFLLAILAIAERLDPRPIAASGRTRGLALATFGMWGLQLALGALVSSNHAGVACSDWPSCSGGVWFPAFEGIVGLQLAHRLGAYALLTLAAAGALSARGEEAGARTRMLLVLVFVQAALGVSNVLLALPVELAVLHSATADAIGVVGALTVLRTGGRR